MQTPDLQDFRSKRADACDVRPVRRRPALACPAPSTTTGPSPTCAWPGRVDLTRMDTHLRSRFIAAWKVHPKRLNIPENSACWKKTQKHTEHIRIGHVTWAFQAEMDLEYLHELHSAPRSIKAYTHKHTRSCAAKHIWCDMEREIKPFRFY